jgi:hypothetical protein
MTLIGKALQRTSEIISRPAPQARAVHFTRESQETNMPKGQQRSNKETKKPKQNKKAPAPASSSVVPQAKSVVAPGKKR